MSLLFFFQDYFPSNLFQTKNNLNFVTQLSDSHGCGNARLLQPSARKFTAFHFRCLQL